MIDLTLLRARAAIIERYGQAQEAQWLRACTDRIEVLEAEVERLQTALAEEQAESLQQAEIARDALAEVERLRALHALADAYIDHLESAQDGHYRGRVEDAGEAYRNALRATPEVKDE